jgi:hypothetical protein
MSASSRRITRTWARSAPLASARRPGKDRD